MAVGKVEQQRGVVWWPRSASDSTGERTNMGKEIPRGFEKIRSGEQIQIPTFTNVAAANAAGVTATKYPRRIIHLSAGGTGAVACLAVSDGTNWKQIAIGNNAL
jgi:hypothetical protein